MWLVVGLGNPGPEYEATYHNVGFRVAERMAAQHGVRVRQECGPSLVSDKILIAGEPAVIVMPQTFMNRSGLALPKVFERFEASAKDVVVVYDDLALSKHRRELAAGHVNRNNFLKGVKKIDPLRIELAIERADE